MNFNLKYESIIQNQYWTVWKYLWQKDDMASTEKKKRILYYDISNRQRAINYNFF